MIINKSRPLPATMKAAAGGDKMVMMMRITSERLIESDMSHVLMRWWKGAVESLRGLHSFHWWSESPGVQPRKPPSHSGGKKPSNQGMWQEFVSLTADSGSKSSQSKFWY